LTPENMGELMHLRVELQSLYRLPRSNAIAFDIRCYLARFDELVTVPKWARRLHRVVRDIHPDLAAYKGFLRNRDMMTEWLARHDDGAPTSPGWWPED
ncbi:MAG: heme-dependent oxidative N-demethylase subunit alpha family protein, partial [Gemmobacter sp.]